MKHKTLIKLDVQHSVSSRKADPCVVTFNNGSLSVDHPDTNFTLYADDSDKLGKRKYLGLEGEKLNYIGNNYSSKSDSCRSYLGILNKDTNKMKIVDLDWFKMQAVIPDNDTSHQETEPDTTVVDQNYQARRQKLMKAFGGMRQQKAVDSRTVKVAMEDSAFTVLESHEVAENVVDPSESDPLENMTSILPTMNRQAESLDEVFDVNDFISDVEWAALRDPAYELATVSPEDLQLMKQNKTYSSVVLESVPNLPEDEEMQAQSAILLMYLECAILLASIKAKSVAPTDPAIANIPAVVKKKLLNKFTGKPFKRKGVMFRKFAGRERDALLAHIVAVAFLACNYQFSITPLSKEIGMRLMRLEQMVRLVGGHVSVVRRQKIAVLKLPLSTVQPAGLLKRGTSNK